jgi:hypothetical protein
VAIQDKNLKEFQETPLEQELKWITPSILALDQRTKEILGLPRLTF